MAHRKEEGTYHCNEKCLDSSAPGKGVPLLLIPEYSGIDMGQRIPDRSKSAHRKPLVKCFLTEDPLSDGEVWQATVHRVTDCWTCPKRRCTHRCKAFFV